jgi:hypothetical protein
VIGEPSFYSSVLPPIFGSACTALTGASTASTLYGAAGVTVDAAGNLYIADEFESRVLEYDTPFAGCTSLPCVGAAAHMIVGQNDASGNKCNKDGATLSIESDTLCNPTGGAVDGFGNLFVSDTGNSRVLEYNNALGACGAGQCISSNANVVFGQPNFTSPFCNSQSPSPSASSLCFPSGLTLDSAGDLFVVDGNNRVLEYYQPLMKAKGNGTGDTVADKVWGQNGSFTSAVCNLGGGVLSSTAASLCEPTGVAVDPAFNVFIADGPFGSRIVEYDHKGRSTGSTTANTVFGQSSFISTGCNFNLGGPNSATANSLCSPAGISLDGSGDLWAADPGNNRVVEYLQPLQTRKC